jgi:hypothetical protein
MARNGNWVSEPVTPYKLTQFLNEAVAEALTEHNGEPTESNIAPQQVYGAVRSGTLEVARFDSGHMKVTPAKANAFIASRIERLLKPSEEESEEEQEEAEANA